MGEEEEERQTGGANLRERENERDERERRETMLRSARLLSSFKPLASSASLLASASSSSSSLSRTFLVKAPLPSSRSSLLLPSSIAKVSSSNKLFQQQQHQQQSASSFASQTDGDRRYHWIEPEAEKLISRAYARHQSLVERDLTLPNGWKSFPPSISLQDLEAEGIATDFHYEPKMGLDSADEATKEEEASAAAGAASGGSLNLRGTPAAAKSKS